METIHKKATIKWFDFLVSDIEEKYFFIRNKSYSYTTLETIDNSIMAVESASNEIYVVTDILKSTILSREYQWLYIILGKVSWHIWGFILIKGSFPYFASNIRGI